MGKYIILLLFIIFLTSIIITLSQHQPIQPPNNAISPQPTRSLSPLPHAVLGQQIKTSDCHVNGALPDTACTPGAIFPNVTKDQICRPGYAKSVRNVPQAEKHTVYAAYSISSHQPGEYEVDHLVSLELGGSNDVANLWPEIAEPRPGYHEKDAVENYLHEQVCNGTLSLADAQQQIATNWLLVYQRLNAQ